MFGWLTQLTHYSCEFTSPWLCWFRLLFLQYLEEAPKMAPANFITFSLRHPCSGFFGIPRWCCLKFVNCKILLFIVICPCTWPQNGGKSAMLIMLRQDKKNFFRLAIMGYNGIYWDMGYNGTSTIIFYPCLSHYIPVKNVLCLLVEFLQNRLRGHAYARRTARSSAADARFCRRNKMGISPKVER